MQRVRAEAEIKTVRIYNRMPYLCSIPQLVKIQFQLLSNLGRAQLMNL